MRTSGQLQCNDVQTELEGRIDAESVYCGEGVKVVAKNPDSASNSISVEGAVGQVKKSLGNSGSSSVLSASNSNLLPAPTVAGIARASDQQHMAEAPLEQTSEERLLGGNVYAQVNCGV